MWRVIARALDFLDFIGYEYEDIDSDSGEMECYLSQFPREVCDKNVECPAVYPKYVLFAK